MDSFSIRLSDGYTQTFSKARFNKLFPTGLLTTSLEGDPETKHIDLTHPCVTPAHLHYLAVITRYGTYTPPPPGMVTKEVGRYLDLPWLEFHDHPCIDLRLINPMTELTPVRALDCAMKPYDLVVAKWAIRQLGKEVNTRTDAITTIVFRGDDDLFGELLRAGLDIKTASCSPSVVRGYFDTRCIKLKEYVLVEVLAESHTYFTENIGSGSHLAILDTLIERQLLPEEVTIKILQTCIECLPDFQLKLVQLISPERYGDIYLHLSAEAMRWVIDRRPDVYHSYAPLYHAVIENWVDYFDDLTKFDAAMLNTTANQAAMEGRWLIYERLRPYHRDEQKKLPYCTICSNPNNLIRAIGADPCITKTDLRCALQRAFFASRGEVSSIEKRLNGDLLVEIWGETTCAEALREI